VLKSAKLHTFLKLDIEDGFMADKTVHLNVQTRCLLTKETMENNRPSGVIVNLDGRALTRDEMHQARTIYSDMGGKGEFMAITHDEAVAAREKGTDVFQGVGEVSGWFLKAPDMTLTGRFGEKAVKAKAN
jgi:hypothetical protein